MQQKQDELSASTANAEATDEAFGVLPEPSAALAAHATREMGWDGRFEVEQLTSRAGRKVLIYNFGDLAGYLLGRDALEKPLIGRLRFMVCRVDSRKLVIWLRDAVGDVALADALDAALDYEASEHDQMVVIRRFLFNRWKQYQRALGNEADGAAKAPKTTLSAAGSAKAPEATPSATNLDQRKAG